MPKENVIKKTPNAPTALIAGGAGFLGSHLAEFLLLKDARVVVLDNFTTGKDVYISSLLKNPKFAVFDVDINQGLPERIQSVDYIVHLAGIETYLSNTDNADLESLLTNAVGTKALLDLARTSDAKFLLGSSTNVYQGLMSSIDLDNYFGKTPKEEKKYSLTEAKRFAEALVWEYYKKYQTDVRIVRLPEVFGPRMNLNSTGDLGRLMKALLENQDLTVYGEGNDREYYLYITDAVAGIAKALFNDDTKGKIYSLVDKEPHTVIETAYLLKGLADRELKVSFEDKEDPIKPKDSNVSEREGLQHLGWYPKISYKEGIIKTLKWFGYEINTNSFKLSKIVERKNTQHEPQQVLSIAQENIAVTKSINDNKGAFTKIKEKFSRDKSSQIQSETPKVELKKREQETQFSLADVKSETTETLSSLSEETTKNEQDIFSVAPPPTAQETTENTPGLLPFNAEVQQNNTKVSTKLSKLSIKSLNKNVFLMILGIFIAFLIVSIAVPSVQTYTHAQNARTELVNYVKSLSNLNSEEAVNSANIAYEELSKTQGALSKLRWVFTIVGKREQYEATQKVIDSGKHFSRAIHSTAKASNPFFKVWGAIESNTETEFDAQQLAEAKLQLSSARESLQFAIGDLKQTNLNNLPSNIKDEVISYDAAIAKMEKGLDIAATLTSDLPQILGAESKKRYLILLQNSNELRPTGGFIGSYAVLELEKGKIAKLAIDDIYNPDGQIDIRSIEVPAPKPIVDLLKEENLHIRNANWNPSFPESAKTIEDLFFKVDESQFDGVLAIDLYFAQELLSVTGPVFLTAYNQEVNAENMYEVTQYHSEFNYEEGSTQKKSFLTILGSKLLEKMIALESEKLPQLVTTLTTAMEEKHFMVYLPNTSFNAKLQENGWTGELAKTTGDYLYVVNANLGGTKANYYVKNEMYYNILSETRDGVLRAELYLDYIHTGDSSAWPGGPYTDYVRVLTQKGTKLTGAELKRNDNFEKDLIEEITIEQAGEYTSFGTNFTVNPQEKVTLVLKYDLPESLSLSKEFKDYKLYWQKQPGTQDYSYNVLFNSPFGLNIDFTQPPAETYEGRVEYKGTLNTDQEFAIKLK